MTQPMTAAAAGKAAPTFQTLPITLLMESPHNPRKHYDEVTIAELADSIREQGIVSPLIVRPKGDLYEIGAGHRRYRAAKRAGIEVVPAIIRELDDDAFIELVMLENIQREDVHELDEANGYRELIDHHGYDVKRLAARLGKSKEYLYKRLKLAGAVVEVQKLFYSRELTAAHVEQIARLPEVSQRVVLEKGLFHTVQAGETKEDVVVSVKQLASFIQGHIQSDLEKAIFDRGAVNLVASTPGCWQCEKRFGNTCVDRACFNQKTNAFIDLKVDAGDWLPATTDYFKVSDARFHWPRLQEREPGSCPNLKTAICLDGPTRTQRKLVCVASDCEVHNPKPKRAPIPPSPAPAIQPSGPGMFATGPLFGDAAPAAAVPAKPERRPRPRPAPEKTPAPRPSPGSREGDEPASSFDKDKALRELGELLDFAERAMTAIERDQLVLARGSTEAAFARAERLRAAINTAVEDIMSPARGKPTSGVAPSKKNDTLEEGLCRVLGREKWATARKSGLTDAQLKQRIGDAFGIAGGSSGPGLTPIQYKGLSNPRFWFNRMSPSGKPTLQGKQLVAKVRAILGIPYPEQATGKTISTRLSSKTKTRKAGRK